MAFRPPSSGLFVDNKYRLAERIGGGGMGDVFRAEPTGGGRPVAVKFLHHELAQNTELSQRFFQEAQAVGRIKHTNVVEIIDVFDFAEGCPVMVMELLRGETLGAKLLRDERLSIEGRQRQRRARAALSVRRSSSRAAYSSSRRRSPGSAK